MLHVFHDVPAIDSSAFEVPLAWSCTMAGVRCGAIPGRGRASGAVNGAPFHSEEGTMKTKMTLRMRAIAIGGAAACMLTAGGWLTADASIPDASGVIHGCYNNASGSLRVIDTSGGSTCHGGETPVEWSQTGPQGSQGPQGPAGPAGATHAWAATSASVVAPSDPNELLGIEVVGVSNLPPGNYVAWVAGETNVTGTGEDFSECALKASGAIMQQQDLELNPPDRGTYALTGAASLPDGGSITLNCGNNIPGRGAIDFVNNSLTVIQVDALN